jgi:hypothetical protein
MRAGLAVILHAALDTFKSSPWLEILNGSMPCLRVVYHKLHHPNQAKYHHHTPLVKAIVRGIVERDIFSLSTTIHKGRAHAKVMGNELLKDIAAKLVV